MEHAEIRAFLDTQLVARLGTLHRGRPYVVPVFAVTLGPRVFFACKCGQKFVDVLKHPQVCLEFDELRPEIGTCRSVLIQGRSALVVDEAERQQVLRRLLARFERAGPRAATARDYPARLMTPPGDSDLEVMAVTVERMTGRETSCFLR